MALNNFLHPERVILSLKSEEKWEIMKEIISELYNAGLVRDNEAAFQAVKEREDLCSTGLERGIAAPHAKTNSVTETILTIGLHKKGVDFDSLDGRPSHLFFLVLTPTESREEHLEILGEIGKIAAVKDICMKLLKAEDGEKVISLLKQI